MKAQQITSLLIVAITTVLSAGGCLQNHKDMAKKEAVARWQSVRAGTALQLAEQQFRSGQLDKSRQTLAEAIATQKDDPRLHLLLAKVLFESQDIAGAQAHLKEAGRLAPNVAEVDYLQGVFAQSGAQWPQAHQAYLTAYRKCPNSLAYLYSLAEAKLALGQAKEAQELLASRFGDFPRSVGLRIAAANSFLIRDDFERAEQLYQQAITIDPLNAEAQEGLAGTYYLAQKYRPAKQLLITLISQSPSPRPDLQRRLAACCLAIGEYSSAVRAYQNCLSEDPNQADVRPDLARAWLLDGQSRKARQELQSLVSQQPNNAQAWELMGHTYLLERKFDPASKAYRLAMDNGADQSELQSLLELCSQQHQTQARLGAEPATLPGTETQVQQSDTGVKQ